MKNQPPAHAFGRLPVAFASGLYKSRRSSEIIFALYVSARSGIEAWMFNESDIRHNTGLHHTLVAAYSRKYLAAGVFEDAGQTPKGSHCYSLNRVRFESYLNSQTDSTTSLGDHERCHPVTKAIASSDVPACHPATSSMSLSDAIPCHRVTTDKEEKKEESITKTDKQAGVRSSFSNTASLRSAPSKDLIAEDASTLNADKFLEAVKELQAESADYEIVVSSRADKAAVAFFRANPDLDADTLIGIYCSILFQGFSYKFRDPKRATPEDIAADFNAANARNSKEYNPLWWQQRSSDVAWFLNNYRNVIAHSYVPDLQNN